MAVPTRYRIRWANEDGGEDEVVVAVDRAASTVTATVPGGQSVTVAAVAARALDVALNYVAYAVLNPEGPLFELEAEADSGAWKDIQEFR